MSCELERMFILQFINHVIKTYIPTEKNKFKKRLKARIIVNIKHPISVLNTARHCKRSSGAGRRCSTAGLQPGNPWVGRWDSLGLHLRAYHQSWAKEVINQTMSGVSLTHSFPPLWLQEDWTSPRDLGPDPTSVSNLLCDSDLSFSHLQNRNNSISLAGLGKDLAPF